MGWFGNRKRALILVWAAAALLGLAAAAAAQAPQRGGTFTLPISDDPPMWPIQGGIYNILVNKLIYDTLVRYHPETLEPVGGLAERWEVSEDGLAYTFHLRQGVKWHDGEPFDAEDVAFTFQVWMNPEVPYYLRANVSSVDRVEVLDPYTVRVHMKNPVASFPVLLGYNMSILPKHRLEHLSAAQLANPVEFLRNPIGTGPFKFGQKVPGSMVRLVANEEYWDGAPYLDAFVFRVVPDVDTQVAQVQAGDLDMAIIEPYHLDAVRNVPGLRIEEAPQVNHFYIMLNHANPIFADRAVRQALSYALDRQSIIDGLMLGMAQPATGPISPLISWAYTADVVQYHYDPEKAERLLDEAGWLRGPDGIRQKDGRRLSFTIDVDPHPIRQGIALVAQENWRRIGAEVNIALYEYNVILQNARSQPPKYDANPNWLVTPPDPDISTYYAGGSPGNTYAYANPEVDRLLELGRATVNQEERARIYHEIQRILAEDAAVLYLYYPSEIRLVNDRVQGLAPVGYRDGLAWAHKIWKQ
ncbi:MAG: ABC transporter substrate-binding protein [Limnochordales bacterium]|nr:ABC transporter substrate-binding protein [Limnochordales bacterium]